MQSAQHRSRSHDKPVAKMISMVLFLGHVLGGGSGMQAPATYVDGHDCNGLTHDFKIRRKWDSDNGNIQSKHPLRTVPITRSHIDRCINTCVYRDAHLKL